MPTSQQLRSKFQVGFSTKKRGCFSCRQNPNWHIRNRHKIYQNSQRVHFINPKALFCFCCLKAYVIILTRSIGPKNEIGGRHRSNSANSVCLTAIKASVAALEIPGSQTSPSLTIVPWPYWNFQAALKVQSSCYYFVAEDKNFCCKTYWKM